MAHSHLLACNSFALLTLLLSGADKEDEEESSGAPLAAASLRAASLSFLRFMPSEHVAESAWQRMKGRTKPDRPPSRDIVLVACMCLPGSDDQCDGNRAGDSEEEVSAIHCRKNGHRRDPGSGSNLCAEKIKGESSHDNKKHFGSNLGRARKLHHGLLHISKV